LVVISYGIPSLKYSVNPRMKSRRDPTEGIGPPLDNRVRARNVVEETPTTRVFVYTASIFRGVSTQQSELTNGTQPR
jgi:hypothetical protein